MRRVAGVRVDVSGRSGPRLRVDPTLRQPDGLSSRAMVRAQVYQKSPGKPKPGKPKPPKGKPNPNGR